MSIFNEFKKLNSICQKPHYKRVGNWMVRNIIREACVPTTYFLLKTPITANQVTFLSLVFAVWGCIAFLSAKAFSFLWLAIMLHLSYYFDHVDGQIARCKNQVSLSGMMLDIITHYVIFSIISFSIGLKAYFESGNIFYIYCGMLALISIISFNLLIDSKYRTFIMQMLKYDKVMVNRVRSDGRDKSRSAPARLFSILHKTCEIHVIINTITVAALLQLFGFEGITATFTWPKFLVVYYAVAASIVAATKIFYLVVTRKVDKEFESSFTCSKL